MNDRDYQSSLFFHTGKMQKSNQDRFGTSSIR
jgi:hypothetical protein